MKFVEIKKLDDCFDGSIVFEYSFNKQIDEMFMKILGQTGKLEYYPDFRRPFYKIMTDEGLQIKGIIGDNNFEITYPLSKKWEKKKSFETCLERFLALMI